MRDFARAPAEVPRPAIFFAGAAIAHIGKSREAGCSWSVLSSSSAVTVGGAAVSVVSGAAAFSGRFLGFGVSAAPLSCHGRAVFGSHFRVPCYSPAMVGGLRRMGMSYPQLDELGLN